MTMAPMKKILFAFVCLAALLLAGAACAPAPGPTPLEVPADAQAGDLNAMEPCEYQPAGRKAKFAAECGTLAVPENWAREGSRLIALPVVRIPAAGDQPAEPVFYLQGGPGQSNLSWVQPDWLFEKRDVVFVGYRGINGTVTLSCPEVNRLLKTHAGKDAFSEQARAEYSAAVKECAAAHQEVHGQPQHAGTLAVFPYRSRYGPPGRPIHVPGQREHADRP